jgi:hypothetical protein
VPTAPSAPSASVPPPLAPPPVLWVKDDLKDVASDAVTFVDALLVSGLKDDAAKVSPAALALVTKKAPLEPTLKTRLESSLSAVGAKHLNAAGVSAENKEEVILMGALATWLFGYVSLRSELKAMVEENKKSPPIDIQAKVEPQPYEKRTEQSPHETRSS